MSEKKKKLIIFGFLSLWLLVGLLAFYYIFKNQNNDNIVNVRQDDVEENNIQERIVKKIGYRPYFAEDEDTSPLHFSSAFLVDTTITVFITVFTTVALIKTEKFEEALKIISKKMINNKKKEHLKNLADIGDMDDDTECSSVLFSAAKYQIIFLSVVYLLSFFVVYPSLFLLLSLYRKISSLSAYNYLKQLVKKNKILVCLYSILGLVLSLITGYFCLYLAVRCSFISYEIPPKKNMEITNNQIHRTKKNLRGLHYQKNPFQEDEIRAIDYQNFLSNKEKIDLQNEDLQRGMSEKN